MQVAVFHPGIQHSWQTALALQQLGSLEWYATSLFYQPRQWPYRIERYLPGRVGRRVRDEFARVHHPDLDPARVRTAGVIEWAERLAARAGMRSLARRLDAHGNRNFARLVAADVSSSEPFALWGYDNSALETFRLGREFGRTCILDRTIGDWRYYDAAMERIAERDREFFITQTRRSPSGVIARSEAEYAAADVILAGSDFAADTVRRYSESPGTAAKVRVLPYCYDERLFAPPATLAPVPRTGPVKFLFVGQVTARKGIQHVLRAIERVPRSDASLTLVGDLGIPAETFARYADRVDYRRVVPRAQVAQIMAEHHVLLFPSYFEGSALSLLEGLASGLAVIQTRQAGNGADESCGVVLDEPDDESVLGAIRDAVADRARLDAWRHGALRRAALFSFARYRENIAELLRQLDTGR